MSRGSRVRMAGICFYSSLLTACLISSQNLPSKVESSGELSFEEFLQQLEVQYIGLREAHQMQFQDLKEMVEHLDRRMQQEKSSIENALIETLSRHISGIAVKQEAHAKGLEMLSENVDAATSRLEDKMKITELTIDLKLKDLEGQLEQKLAGKIQDVVESKFDTLRAETVRVITDLSEGIFGLQVKLDEQTHHLTRKFEDTKDAYSMMQNTVNEVFQNISGNKVDLCLLPTVGLWLDNKTAVKMTSELGHIQDMMATLLNAVNDKILTILESNKPVEEDINNKTGAILERIEFITKVVQFLGTRSNVKETHHVGTENKVESDGKEWLTILRRMDGSVNFTRLWTDYKNGFGNTEREFWIGNDIIYKITTERAHELLVDLEDWSGEKLYAKYSAFRVGPKEAGYTLYVDGFNTSSTAGNSLRYHNGMKFSTVDVDNDHREKGNCAKTNRGGFWYKSCHYANPMGPYERADYRGWKGITWFHAYRDLRSFKTVEMKIRPL